MESISPEDEIAMLLQKMAGNDSETESRLAELCYTQLRAVARRLMRSERPGHTLQPTALVNEVWMKLSTGRERSYQNREHFFAIAATCMRQILLDHARSRLAKRRAPDGEALGKLQEQNIVHHQTLQLVALDDALRNLEATEPRLAKIIELRCFGELSVEETARVMGLSPTTVKREWKIARTLLAGEISRGI